MCLPNDSQLELAASGADWLSDGRRAISVVKYSHFISRGELEACTASLARQCTEDPD